MALRVARDRDRAPLSHLSAGTGPIPVLLVHGNFAGKQWWRDLLSDPPGGTRLLALVAHGPQIEAPELVNDLLAQLLDAVADLPA